MGEFTRVYEILEGSGILAKNDNSQSYTRMAL